MVETISNLGLSFESIKWDEIKALYTLKQDNEQGSKLNLDHSLSGKRNLYNTRGGQKFHSEVSSNWSKHHNESGSIIEGRLPEV